MITATQKANIRPVHPFPARMAPSIIWDVLSKAGESLNILDPMAGSGTTLVCARSRGHKAVGCDRDPLALLISRAWCSNIEPEAVRLRAKVVLKRAQAYALTLPKTRAYPINADTETRQFIDYWYDSVNRRQLCALSTCISRVQSTTEMTLLWCAFSRMIVTKVSGVSLAMDISHSRPHKVYDAAPMHAFDIFLKAVGMVVSRCPFPNNENEAPPAIIKEGDARALPIESSTMDIVITSPPYLNAIDYLRGHKFSLVWMGHNISEIRQLRSENIGTEISQKSIPETTIQDAMMSMGEVDSLSNRHQGMIRRYVCDMSKVMEECTRVLKCKGQAVFVVGNSAIRSVFIKNSEALIRLAENNGLTLLSCNNRPIEPSRRYMPPPESERSGNKMQSRMREEVILQFIKE